MNNSEKQTQDAGRARFFMDNYDLIANEIPIANEGKRRISDPMLEGHKRCRFCGKNDRETGFNHEAHAISEMIGNRKIILDNECDNCNHFFGEIVEDSFAKYLGISRTLSQTKGKNGYVSFKSKDGRFRMDIKEAATVIQTTSDWPIAELKNDSIVFCAPREKYTPIDAYRTLVKNALSVIPFEESIPLIKDYVWVRADRRKEEGRTILLEYEEFVKPYASNVFETFIPGPKPLQLQIRVFRRKKKPKEKVPYCQAVLEFDNYRFQYILPSEYDVTEGESFSFRHIRFMGEEECLPEYRSFVSQYGMPETQLIDLSAHEPVKGEQIVRRLAFDKKIQLSAEDAEKLLKEQKVKRLKTFDGK